MAKKSKADEDYLYVGADLRDKLISAIGALGWDEDKERADKITRALQLAAPYREKLEKL